MFNSFFVQGSPSSGGSQYGGQVRVSSCSTSKLGTFVVTEKLFCENSVYQITGRYIKIYDLKQYKNCGYLASVVLNAVLALFYHPTYPVAVKVSYF